MSNLLKLQTPSMPWRQRDGQCLLLSPATGHHPGCSQFLPFFTVIHYLLSFPFSFSFLKGVSDGILTCQGFNAADIGKGKLKLKMTQTTEAGGFMTPTTPRIFHFSLTRDKLKVPWNKCDSSLAI